MRRDNVKIKKFWNWVESGDERTLYLEGAIAEESWYGDEVTPKAFKTELLSGKGDITVWINSPGGDVIAASQIYNMLMDYKGQVIVKIDGIAASAASVIAMAGSKVQISPTGLLMIHNPMTMAFGNEEDMERAKAMLSEVKESILNAYELKTGLSRAMLSHLMDSETWFNAKKAVELKFADEILFSGEGDLAISAGAIYSNQVMMSNILNKLPKGKKKVGMDIGILTKRLDLLKK